MIQILAIIGTFEQTALFSGNAERDIATHGDTTQEPGMSIEIGCCVVLGGAVVPDGNVPRFPVPADGVVNLRDVRLEDLQQPVGMLGRDAANFLEEMA